MRSPQCASSARSSKRNVSIEPRASGWDGGVAKPQFGLHAIGHRGIDLGEARPKLPGELSHRRFLILRLRRRYGVESRRWGAVEIAPELTCENVPKRDGSKFGQCRVVRKLQAELR